MSARLKWKYQSNSSDDGSFEERGYSPPSLAFLGLVALSLSSLFALVGVTWQHVAAVTTSATAAIISDDVVQGTVGIGAMILGWFAFGLLGFLLIVSYSYFSALRDLKEIHISSISDD